VTCSAAPALDAPGFAVGLAVMQWLQTSIGRLRVIGFWEGVSFLVLLGLAMPLKYLAGEPGAVRVVGLAHGVLFMLYVAAALQAAFEHKWPWKKTALILLASLLPAGPFIVDAKLLREPNG
jgi:integral membrane protein